MKNILLLVFMAAPFASMGQGGSFYFDKAQASLLDSSATALDSFYQLHLKDHSARIQLRGYSDTIGRLSFNQVLTDRRIQTVVDYFSQKGFPTEQIQTEHMGEVATAVGQEWQNRRVEILLEEKPDMYEQMLGKDHRTQVIEFSNTNDTILMGAEGTEVIVPKNAFVDSKGNRVKQVTLELKEYYKVEDIVLSNLSTITTDGQLMETNGMFYIKAYDKNGNPCKLVGGKSIDVKIPEVRDATNMNLYKGKKVNGVTKWKRKSERKPFKYGVIRTKYSFIQKRKRYTSQRAIALLDAHLKQHLIFPENALNNNRCGRVKVEFYIDSEGNLVNPSIKGRGIPGAINKHVMKTLRETPRLHASHLRDNRALSFKYSIVLKFVTQRCFRDFNNSNREVLSLNWATLEPKAYWDKQRDAVRAQNISQVMYRTGGLGWHNCDALVGRQNELVSMPVAQRYKINTDFKLLMVDLQIILSDEYQRNTLMFSNVLPTGKAWLLGIKYEDGQTFFSKTPVDLAVECPQPEPFRKVSIEELKTEISELRRTP